MSHDVNCFKQFMMDQIREIEVHKWIESEKANRDLGQECVVLWIKLFAKSYRQKWFSEH